MLWLKLPQPATASSSLPSGQSLSPSHNQFLGTQAYDPGQLNKPGAHVAEPVEKTETKQHNLKPTFCRNEYSCLKQNFSK